MNQSNCIKYFLLNSLLIFSILVSGSLSTGKNIDSSLVLNVADSEIVEICEDELRNENSKEINFLNDTKFLSDSASRLNESKSGLYLSIIPKQIHSSLINRIFLTKLFSTDT